MPRLWQLSLHLQWHCVKAFSQTISVPFYLIACCFVGSGCLMLNEDPITKALFLILLCGRLGMTRGQWTGNAFIVPNSGPPLCLWAKFTLLDEVPR